MGRPISQSLGFENRMQTLSRLGLAQLLEGASFELTHAFSRQAERLSDLFESVFFLAAESVAQS